MKKLLIFLLLLVSLLSSPLTFARGLGSSVPGSQVYDIDYRGPETHSFLPPPDRFGRRPFPRHGRLKHTPTTVRAAKLNYSGDGL